MTDTDDGMVLSLWRGLLPVRPEMPSTHTTMRVVTDKVYDEIMGQVERDSGISREAVESRSRYTEVSRARQYAMWLFRQRRDRWGRPIHSYPSIAAALGLDDHTTVMWGVKRHQARIDASRLEAAA